MKPDERLESDTFVLLVVFAVFLLFLATAILGIMSFLATELTQTSLLFLKEDVFTKDTEMRLMGCKPQHDKIGIKTIDYMPSVGVMVW
jgi:hypothetical protein